MRIPLDLQPRTVTASDGVPLRYFDSGPRGEDSTTLPLVLANGLGGPISALGPLAAALDSDRRVLSWDYRGLYGSCYPGPHRRTNVAQHARDILEILDRLEIDEFTFFGWSMGGQVGFEVLRRAGSRLRALALLNGVNGRPLRKHPLPFAERWLPPALRVLSREGARLEKWLRLLNGAPRLRRALRAGLVSPRFPASEFDSLLLECEGLDLHRYFELLRQLVLHDASDVPLTDVPLLVLSGARDHILPARRVVACAKLRPEIEVVLLDGLTHYAALEAPKEIAAHLRRFLHEQALPLRAGSAQAMSWRADPLSSLREISAHP